MRKYAGWIWALVIIAVIVIVVLVKKPHDKMATTDGQVIKIGAVLSMTGIASQDGESIKNGLELAKKELAAKGVNVEINYQDDGTDPKKTISGIQFVKSWGAEAIVGPTWSFLGDAAAPVLSQIKVVGYQPADTSEYVTKSDYVFFGAIKLAQEKSTLVKFFKENDVKTVGFIGNQGGWGETNNMIVAQAAAEVGATVSFTSLIPYGKEVDTLGTLLIKVKEVNPDVIVGSIDDDQGISLLLNRISQYGLKSKVIAVTTSFSRVLAAGDAVKNSTVPVYTLLPESSPEFIAKYKTEYGKEPSSYADSAYDGLYMLVEGIMKKGDADLKDYLKSNSYKGLLYTYKFDENNDIVGGSWYLQKSN